MSTDTPDTSEVTEALSIEETSTIDASAGAPSAELKPELKPEPKPDVNVNAKRYGVVVSGADTDEVFISKCVYMNKAARKSLSVHHLQRRLIELGYRDAGSDKDGWYGEGTRTGVSAFQAANSITGDGLMDGPTLVAIFAGDPHVTVVLS